MSSSTVETSSVLVIGVAVTDDSLSVELTDGRTIGAPLAWYPRSGPRHAEGTPLVASDRGRTWDSLAGPRRRYQRGESARRPSIERKPSVLRKVARGKESQEGESATLVIAFGRSAESLVSASPAALYYSSKE